MRLQGTGRRLPLAPAAVAGAVLGHALIYLAAVPDAQARAALLAQSGHGYWPVAIAVATVLGAVAAAGTVSRHLRAGLRRAPRPAATDGLGATARRLALLQTGIFVVQEAAERVAAGAPLPGLLQHHELLLSGVAVQVLVALGMAAVLGLLGRAAEAVGRALRRPAPARLCRRLARWPAVPARRARRAGPAAAIRAPPLPAS